MLCKVIKCLSLLILYCSISDMEFRPFLDSFIPNLGFIPKASKKPCVSLCFMHVLLTYLFSYVHA